MRIVSILYLLMVVACGGQGCSGCGSAIQKIPGGFPIAQRQPNAVQIRATQGLFDFISAHAPAFIGKFLPAGGIPIPSNCGSNPQICCNASCSIDVGLAGLTFAPQPPQSMQMTVNVNLNTPNPLPVHYGITCKLSVNTGSSPVGLQANLNATIDPVTRLTSLNIDPSSVNILNLKSSDLNLTGGILCDFVDLIFPLFFNSVSDQLKKALGGPLSAALGGVFCETCADPKVDCAQFPNVTCGDNTGKKRCAISSGACTQRIGTEARIDAGSLLAGFSAGKAGNLDLILAAGGYAEVEAAGGLSLGMLGGAIGSPQSSCVPMRAPPAGTAPAPSPDYKSNTAPNGQAYHFGMGISALELNQLGYSFYNAGGLCLKVGTDQVSLLSTGILGAIVPSLAQLTRSQPAGVFLLLKPQQPPTFTLGKGTFKTDTTGKTVIDDPLLTMAAQDLAIDFYLFMDDRYVRFMRLTTDVALPLGLEVDSMSRLVPVLGDLTKALGNIRISNSALLAEDPAMLASLLPALLPTLLGSIGNSIAPITLPSISGFSFTPVQITSTAGASGTPAFLGLFLKLGLAKMAVVQDSAGVNLAQASGEPVASAETQARLVSLRAATATQPPQVELQVDAWHPASSNLEWQYRTDDGLWRPFSTGHRLVVDDESLRLPGAHSVEVRARVVDAYATLDETPARVEFTTELVLPATRGAAAQAASGTAVAAPVDGTSGATGCSVTALGSHGRSPELGSLGLGLLVLLALGLAVRRASPRSLRRLGAVGAGAGLLFAAANGCSSSGSSPDGGSVGPGPNGPATVLLSPSDEIGRWLSAGAAGTTIYLSAYDTDNGDLAYAEVTDPTKAIPWEVVDGLPTGATPATTGYRLGYSDPGPDVGRYTSLAMNSQGRPVIAYQDVTNGAVKLATLPGPSSMSNRQWTISVVALGQMGARYGTFTQLTLDSSDVPTVAFRAEGVQHMDGRFVSQLMVAQAKSATPASPSDWTVTVVDEADMSCAGLCGTSASCVAQGGSAQTAYYCKAASGTCNPACAKGQFCLANVCTAALATAPTSTPTGTGINNHLVPNGKSGVLLFYSKAQGALLMAQGPGWKPAVVDGGAGANVGAYVGGAMAADGTLHMAYQDVATGHLLYRTMKNGMAGAVETADAGVRGTAPNQETHIIGAGATLYLDASGSPQVLYQDQTAGTLELAQRSSNGTWSQSTKATGNTQDHGFFAQTAALGGKQQLLDVLYDHTGNGPLSSAAITAGP